MTSLRYALRSLAKSKLFVAISILALGTGLGLSTTMFSVMDAIINPVNPFRDPASLYRVGIREGRRSGIRSQDVYRMVRERTQSFAGVAPVSFTQLNLEEGNRVQRVSALIVGAEWFAVTGIRIRRGRAFTGADREGAVIVTEEAWRGRFEQRRNFIGSQIMLGGMSHTVVGIMPRGSHMSDFYLPLRQVDSVGSIGVWPVVRLKPGVTREEAEQDMAALSVMLSRAFGSRDEPIGLTLNTYLDTREEIKDIHKAMVGAALVVLIIACVNLAHLMLARGIAKRRELALRMALGATRTRVVGQMFLECALITLGGAAVGGLIAIWGAWLLRHYTPSEVFWIGAMKPQLSWRVFAASAIAAALSAVFFGLIPAIRVALGVSLDDPLKDDAGTTTARTRYRYNPLVAVEVGLALVLMMGGALLLRTIVTLQRTENLAFNARNLWQAWVTVPPGPDSISPSIPPHEVLASVRRVPGVLSAATRDGSKAPGNAIMAEQTGDTSRFISTGYYSVVSVGYFQTLGLPILHGRDFGSGDEGEPGVAILDAIAAQRLYPNQEAVGRMIKLGGPASDARWVRVVGVVRSEWVLEASQRAAQRRGAVYVSRPPAYRVLNRTRDQVGQLIWPQMSLVARTQSKDAAQALQSRLNQMGGRYASVIAYDFQREAELASRGFLAKVFVIMGVVALGLATLGLYAVLAYSVNRRMREFAIRLALGAEPRGLRRMILHDGFVMILAGIGAGAFVALATTRYLDAVLIAVLPSDVISLVACEIVLFGAGLAAALSPARRAAKANPLEILRAS